MLVRVGPLETSGGFDSHAQIRWIRKAFRHVRVYLEASEMGNDAVGY